MLKGPAAAGLCPEKGVWERADACWKVSGRKSKKEMAQEGKGITARTETLTPLPVIPVSRLFLHSFSHFSKVSVQSNGFPCVVFMTVLIPDSCSYPPLHNAFLYSPRLPLLTSFLPGNSPPSAFLSRALHHILFSIPLPRSLQASSSQSSSLHSHTHPSVV